MHERIQLLDCTLRDGGFALEDAAINGWTDECFTEETIGAIRHNLELSRAEIIEIGAVEISKEDKRKFAIYQDIQSISQTLPEERSPGRIYATMYRGPDTPLENIPEWQPSYCEATRVILRYSELQKSLDFCKGLAQRGYKVFVQPMLTMRYTDDELQMIIDAANDMNAYALYFVDSYGYMHPEDVITLFKRYDASLNPDIRIGFHAHNHLNLAFANVLTFLNQESTRMIIVDACAIGMGQGAGNMQTEVLADYLNHRGKAYNYDAILNVCEIIDDMYTDNLWGYSVTRMLPAIHHVAYKYALSLRKKYGLSLSEIDHIFRNIPEELRHRYTLDNTRKLLTMNGYSPNEPTRRKT